MPCAAALDAVHPDCLTAWMDAHPALVIRSNDAKIMKRYEEELGKIY
jgi:hypothetical protein